MDALVTMVVAIPTVGGATATVLVAMPTVVVAVPNVVIAVRCRPVAVGVIVAMPVVPRITIVVIWLMPNGGAIGPIVPANVVVVPA
jgi:hypothetical protein